MKKIVSILLVMMLLVFSIVGCGKSDKQEAVDNNKVEQKQDNSTKDTTDKKDVEKKKEKITLTYWTLFGGGDGEIMEAIVSKFNKEHEDIQVEAVTLKWKEYYTKLATGVSGGKGPDIGISHTSKLPELIEQGVVVPIDEYAAGAGVDWNSFNQNLLNATIEDGKHYALPLDTHPQVMFYNKAMFKDIGLLNDDGTLKFEDSGEGFVAFLEEAKSKLPEDKMVFASNNRYEEFLRLFWAMYHQQGGNGFVSADGKKSNIDKEKAINAFNYIKTLLDKGYIPQNIEKPDQLFTAQTAGIFMSGVWNTGSFEKTEGLEFGVASIPTFFGDTPKAWGDSHTFVLPASNSKDEARAEAALYFMNYVTEQGIMWAKAGHIPAKTAVVESDEFAKLPYRKDYAEVASNVAFSPSTTKNWAIKSALKEVMGQFTSTDMTSEQALEAFAKEVDRITSK